ncbi:hypothetical protein [Methanosarcina sp. DH2]|jgi:hypothetical protein|uniref:hypothetical protein n=1 Tax=Methanosarcina sp. DH2 TaxID=2605639 RepID=UPI001E455FED|nr:hypothetical protein [Methanosarcina sp. DH2]
MKGHMEYVRKLKYIWRAKFIAHLPEKDKEVKTMSKTDKIIAPEVTKEAVKDEKVSNPDVKVETSK